MKPIDIVERIKDENPEALAGMGDKQAARLIRAVFEELGKQLANAEEGTVKVAGLGGFRIRNVEVEREGTTVSVKRIRFKALDEEKRQERRARKHTASAELR